MYKNNIDMIETVVTGLGNLSGQVVFVGGSVAQLYVDRGGALEIRPTNDVDAVITVSTPLKFRAFERTLEQRGFLHDTSAGAPICRWTYADVKFDLMPDDASILGFSNKWYQAGRLEKQAYTLPSGRDIFLLSLPYYLASKLVAVQNRGLPDLRFSHDFEDVVFLLDNCQSITTQILTSSAEVKAYICTAFQLLFNADIFEEALFCVLPYGATQSYKKVFKIIEKLVQS